ncbi:hypothetical protein [Ramlibacter albus]|uniref:Uncharacterized protein n=1 Tax=Ramlibacter albus TaxID=2079448 RepID=A0A923MCD7_9BURK|nr:hypothetical protein [Ramlibacter albus]MBC5766809.1 hypothetical protein [Ramlibacter albus]
MARLALSLLTFFAATAVHAQSSCSSDGVPAPVAVLERFISADCESCWQDPKAPHAGHHEVALDWVVPGAKGDDAPLAAVATRDALARLEALRRGAPARADSVRTVRTGRASLRVAQGLAFNDYVGASLDAKQPGSAWLVLVEELPAGTEGSAVARNLVRNVLHVERRRGAISETRSMQIPEGAKAERLRVVGLLFDERGRLSATAVSACP